MEIVGMDLHTDEITKQFVVTMDAPLQWKEVDDVFIVTGVALAPGTYQGIDGAKIEYSPEVCRKSAESLLGIDYMTAHSPTGKFGGTVVGQAIEGDAALYKAVVTSPEAIANVKSGFGTSTEADVKTIWDNDKQDWRAVEVKHKKLCQTDTPACPASRVLSVKEVRLEKKEENEMDDKALNELKAEYDSKTSEINTKLTAKESELKTVKEEKDVALGKIKDLEKERDEFKSKYESLTETIQKAELEKLAGSIKAINKDFDATKFLEGTKDFGTQKIVLSKYLETLEGIKAGTVKLSVDITGAGTRKERANQISRDFFGVDLEDAANQTIGTKEEKK